MEDVVVLYAEAVEWFSSAACWSVIVAAKAIPIKFVQFIFHFVILTLNCALWVPCSTGLATLASAKQAHTDPHVTVFTKDKTATHLPHDMQQSIQSRKSTVTGHSNGQRQD